MNEEDLMIADDQDLEELLRQRLLAKQDQEQVGIGAGGAIGAGLAGFGSLLAGQNPLAATQSVLNSAQQMEQQRLRAKALENQATLGALRNISQERMRKEQFQNTLDRLKEQDRLRQEEWDRRFPMESAERARRAAMISGDRKEMALAKAESDRLRAEQDRLFRSEQSEIDRSFKAEQAEKDRAARALLAKEGAAQKGAGKGDGRAPVIPGLQPIQGAEPTSDDVKKVKASQVAMDRFGSAISSLRNVVAKYGTRTLLPSERAQIERAASDVVIEGKEAARLGALAGPDMDIILASIGNPGGAKAALMGTDAYLKLLDDASKDSYNKYKISMRSYGYQPIETQKQSVRSTGPDKQAVINELRRRGLVK